MSTTNIRTTDFASARRVSVLAGIPSTVTMSPTCNALRFQPSLSNSSGLPNSTAQFVIVPAALLTTTRNVDPLSVVVVAGVV